MTQDQRSLYDQLVSLKQLATKNGHYDAADWLDTNGIKPIEASVAGQKIAAKPPLDANNIRHRIGNQIFALEANLEMSMKYPTDYKLREAMQRCAKTIKEILESL